MARDAVTAGSRPVPHVPAWLAGAVEAVVAANEAEAVFLIGSQARGDARPDSDVNLLVLVDNHRIGFPRLIVEDRQGHAPGYVRPVTLLFASLAELNAGIYSGHPRWTAIAREAFPLHDPAGTALMVAARLADAPVTGGA